jgi:cell division protein ZapA
MAQVTVTIAGRAYRMACGEGEEANLQRLARQLDERMQGLRKNFGEIGDQRLTIMAAITVADQLAEANRRIAELEGQLLDLKSDAIHVESDHDEWADRLAGALDDAAGRIERMAHDLNSTGRE